MEKVRLSKHLWVCMGGVSLCKSVNKCPFGLMIIVPNATKAVLSALAIPVFVPYTLRFMLDPLRQVWAL